MQIKNLKLYIPPFKTEEDGDDWEVYNQAIQLARDSGAVFYIDESGQDWYKARDSWPDNGMTKLAFLQDGRIYCHSLDIQQIIVHEGTSVVEVHSVPADFKSHYHWYWRGGALVEDIEAVQTMRRNRLMLELDDRINILQYRIDDDDAREGDAEELAARRKMRVALRRLDVSVKIEEWPNTSWPRPESA